MNDPRFLQEGFDKQLSHLIEECGEVLSAAGKLQRWGPESYNPFVPEQERETNLAWLRREMKDLKETLQRLEWTIEKEYD